MRDWEACYQNGETPWDKGSAAPPLVELIERLGTGLWGGGTVLVPGCGLGHDVRCLAGRGLKVTGLDLSKQLVLDSPGRHAGALSHVGGEPSK